MAAAADSNKRPRPPDAEEPRCRYLRFTNLPHGCTSDELKMLLDPSGKVEDCRVSRATDGGMLAMVEMSCTREATSAKRQFNDFSLRGANLAVNFDHSRSETTAAAGAPAIGGGAPEAASGGPKPPMPPPARTVAPPAQQMVAPSKLPPFYVPDRMVRDVHANCVVKMRSVLWTAREDDIRQFFRGLQVDRDGVEMGRDHAGRFSGMVFVRFRTAADTSSAMRRANDLLNGRNVILSRVDSSTPGIFPPRDGVEMGGVVSTGLAASPARPGPAPVEPRPWPAPPTAAEAAAARSKKAEVADGHVGVHFTVGPKSKGQAPSLQRALSSAPVDDALQAVRHFLAHDPRLPLATRNAAQFLDTLRGRLLDDSAPKDTTNGATGSAATATSTTGAAAGASAGEAARSTAALKGPARHLFRSPFEVAGVHGYSMPEVEHVFGTRSSDSVFWPIFSTFHTLLPHHVDEPTVQDATLEDFLAP